MIITETLPSRLEAIPEFIASFLEKIKPFRINDDDIFDIRISLEEALVNAIKHGNRFNAALPVDVSIDIIPARVTIAVKNQGKGFDYAKIPNPTKDDNLQKLSGRGVFLIKSLMDAVEFFDCGRGIKMVKSIKKRGKNDKGRAGQ
ncbi:MAG: ATP-binding protein [Candidatus Omnitrophica bacterium]|nr:ATP-binding protein [Candidatus Omnitrophota bacterium]